jgi:hypothetical protein
MRQLTAILPPLAFALVFAVASSVASPALETKTSTPKSTTETANHSATSNSTAKSTPKATAKKQNHALASAEELSGAITAVDPSDKEVTLVGSNGVPYDFDLGKTTRVELSGQKIAASQIAGETNKQATVHFVPTARGNLADSIQISGS